jgi:FtsH-binding integral membrane protein
MTPASEAGLDGMGRAPSKGRAVGRKTGTAMAAEAATFALASVVHFATSFADAAIPELLIAAVLGLGSAAVISRRPHAWGAAVGTTSFATFGTIVGLTIIATGRQDAPDLAYHATILTALAATLIALCRRRDAARRPAARSRPPLGL